MSVVESKVDVSKKTSSVKDLQLKPGDVLFHKETGGYTAVLQPAQDEQKLITIALDILQIGDIVDGIATIIINGMNTLTKYQIEPEEKVIVVGNFETLAPFLVEHIANG